MAKKQHSKAEKAAYFKSLRLQWQAAKKHAENGGGAEFEAIIASHGLNISMTGFILVNIQMRAQNLDGMPYLDAKTFMGWKENGFKVRKGEKSTLNGITWIGVKPKDQDDDKKSGYAMPKQYHLFHRSQVDAI